MGKNKKDESEFVMVPESDGGFHPLHRSQFEDYEPNKDKQIKNNQRKIDIKKWINELPKYQGWDNEVKNILRYDKELVDQEEKEYQKRLDKNTLPAPQKEKVYVDTILTRQQTLNRQTLLEYADKGIESNKDPISAVRYKGEVILLNGNHRVSIAKLNSQKEIELLITDLDKKKRLFKKRK